VRAHKSSEDDQQLGLVHCSLQIVPPSLPGNYERSKLTGQWLFVSPSTVNGTELSTQEFRDAWFLHYGRYLGDMPSHCDGCGQKSSIEHLLHCMKGGNAILRRNAVRDELADLAAKAIIPSAIRNEPLIHFQVAPQSRCQSWSEMLSGYLQLAQEPR
jgi:hypothetical protein